MDREGYLEAALKYAALQRTRTISRNGARVRPQMRGRPIPHYQNPIYNSRNNKINFQVQHRPAIIHPRNMMYANMHGVHGVHYKSQKPHMRTQDTARFCNSLGYVLPAPKLLTRNAKIASNNKQQLEAVKEKSRTSSKLSSNSPTAPSAPSAPTAPTAPSATTKRNSKTNNTPPRNTPKVLQGKTRVMRLSRSTNRRSNV
uniref:Uncharacterized protein n=1 Tax=viral metagenome TaxID=1070528 RepID=A0A6C0IB54_9ZZZZ